MTSAVRPDRPSRALVVNYHYCRPAGASPSPATGVTPDALDRQLACLANRWQPADPSDFPLPPQDGRGDEACLITFDDGTRDVFDYALPVVIRHRMPGVVFCCSQPYLEKRVLNVQKTHLLHVVWGWNRFRAHFMAALAQDPEGSNREDVSGLGLAPMYRYDEEDTAAFKRLLNVELPYQVVNRVLDRLFESEYGPQEDVVEHLYMSLDDVRRCVDRGIHIGVHTHSHCMLSRLSPADQEREITMPLELFRDELGLPVTFLSYPYGIAGAWNDTTKTISRVNGLRAAFTLARSVYDPARDCDPFEIPRFDVNDVFTAAGTVKIDT